MVTKKFLLLHFDALALFCDANASGINSSVFEDALMIALKWIYHYLYGSQYHKEQLQSIAVKCYYVH